jgi:hypothetical protein
MWSRATKVRSFIDLTNRLKRLGPKELDIQVKADQFMVCFKRKIGLSKKQKVISARHSRTKASQA